MKEKNQVDQRHEKDFNIQKDKNSKFTYKFKTLYLADRAFLKAEKNFSQGNFLKAKYLYNKALKLYRMSSLDNNFSEIFFKLGENCRLLNELSLAKKFYEKSIKIAKKDKNNILLAKTYCGLSLYYRMKFNFKKALEFCNMSIRKFKGLQDNDGLGFCYLIKGGIYRFCGKLKKSKFYFDYSLKYANKNFNNGYSLCGCGGIYRVLGKTIESLKFYKKAKNIFSKLRDNYGLAYAYCGIANALQRLKLYKYAMKYYRKALKLYRKSKDLSSCGYVYLGIANVCLKQNILDSIQDLCDIAKECFDFTEDWRGKVYLLIIKAEFDWKRNRLNTAVQKLHQALKISKRFKFSYETNLISKRLKNIKKATTFEEII